MAKVRYVTIHMRDGEDTVSLWMENETAGTIRGRLHKPEEQRSAALALQYGDTEP